MGILCKVPAVLKGEYMAGIENFMLYVVRVAKY
jgi:hypothetical protein